MIPPHRMAEPGWAIAATVDVTGQVCPMTYVRTKLKLETLSEGEVLEVLLKGEEPLRNLPRSAREEGHEVLLIETLGEQRSRLLLKKGRAPERRG